MMEEGDFSSAHECGRAARMKWRVLHLANQVSDAGNGIINAMVDLACTQSDSGDEVAVASSGGEFETLLARYGVKHFGLPSGGRTRAGLAGLAPVIRAIRRWDPDIVHAHMMTGALQGWLAKLVHRARLVTHVHNEFDRHALLMGLGDRVIAVSASTARSLCRRGIPPRKLVTVCNGPLNSPRRSGGRPAEGCRRNPKQIITVAGMNPRKGIVTLIDAFTEVADTCPSASLVLVGDGPNRNEYELYASRTRHHNRIRFHGFIADPTSLLLQSSIFVLASLRDPCPLVIAEAREAGCAIVASDVDGIPEALDGGEAGLLVPPGDVAAFADCLRRLLSDPAELTRRQVAARENLGWLSVERVCREVAVVYDGMLTARE